MTELRPPPQKAPVVRPASRLVVLNDSNEILLFHIVAPDLGEPSIWITPGGGLEERARQRSKPRKGSSGKRGACKPRSAVSGFASTPGAGVTSGSTRANAFTLSGLTRATWRRRYWRTSRRRHSPGSSGGASRRYAIRRRSSPRTASPTFCLCCWPGRSRQSRSKQVSSSRSRRHRCRRRSACYQAPVP